MQKITVLLVDDHAFFRKSLRVLLEGTHRVKVVAEAENGKMAVELAGTFHPELVIMDVQMPLVDGIEACKLIKQKYPEMRIILYSMYEIEVYKNQVKGIADKLIEKDEVFEELINIL